jgi:hypothetical protein
LRWGGKSGGFEGWVEGTVGFRDIDWVGAFVLTLRCWFGGTGVEGIVGAFLRYCGCCCRFCDLGKGNIVFIFGIPGFGRRSEALFFELQEYSIGARLETKNASDVFSFPFLVLQPHNESLWSVLGLAGFSMVLLWRMSNLRGDRLPSNAWSIRLSRLFVTDFGGAQSSMFLGLFGRLLL